MGVPILGGGGVGSAHVGKFPRNIVFFLKAPLVYLFFRSSSTQQVVLSVESGLPTFSFRPSREKPLEGGIISNSSWATMGLER